MSLAITIQPTAEPFGLEEAKRQLRIFDELSDDEESDIDGLIATARQETESLMGRSLAGTKTYQVLIKTADLIDGISVELLNPPLIAVTLAESLDEDLTATAISSGDYIIDREPVVPRLTLASDYSLPSDSEWIRVTYTAGYASVGDVPREYIAPIKVRMTQLYQFPTGIPDQQNKAWERMCARYGLNYGVL